MFKVNAKDIPIGIYNKTRAKDAISNGIYKYLELKISPFLFEGTEASVKYEFYLLNSIASAPLCEIVVSDNDLVLSKKAAFDYKDDNELVIYICYQFYLEYFNKMSDHDKDVLHENLLSELKKLEDENKEKIIALKRTRSLDKLKPLLDKVKKLDVIRLNDLVHLEVLINLSMNTYSLGLKVGIDKTYVVQNQWALINAISEGLEVKYGKNLEFKHLMSNFDERSQRIIKMMKNNYSHIQSDFPPKQMPITTGDFDEIMDIMKGELISFVDRDHDIVKNYIVSLNNYDFKAKFNDNYQLLLDEYPLLITGEDNDYVLDKGEVKLANYSDMPNKNGFRLLVHELYNLKGDDAPSFEYLEDVFKKEIYPRYNKFIEVSDNVKEEMDIVNYEIRAYFDYKDILSLETKFFKDDIEVDFDEAKDYLITYDLYENYINELGFVDDEITEMEKIVNFLRSDLGPLKEVCDVYLSENIRKLKVKSASKITAHMSYDVDMMGIFFKTSEFSDKELNEIVKSIKKKTRFIKLNKDTILDLNDENIQDFYNTVVEFNLDSKALLEKQEVQLYQSLKLASEDLKICEYKLDGKLKDLLDEIKNYKKANFDYPTSLKDVARPYQKDAYQWMKTLIKYKFCGILADDMGLGKTLEVISVMKSDDEAKPSLIVCPKSLCYNWKNEFSLWGKEIEVVNVIGSGAQRKEIILSIDKDKKVVYITSYDSLRNDIDLYNEIGFRFLILDEAQSIKNHTTLKAQSVKLVKSDLRFVLTGTPIENSIIDLWSIFDFLMPRYLGIYSDFKGKYEKSIVEHQDKDVIERLVKKIAPFVLRRTKEEVLKDLPSKVEFIQIASMDSEQQKLYDSLIKKTRDKMQAKDSKIEILAMLTRLRQICVDPELCAEDYTGKSCKLELLMELVTNYLEDGHKIVIFSQFISVFPKIQRMLNEKNIKYFTLTGETDALDRVNMATEFNKTNSSEKVFLVSLKSGGTGLNLIGADVVIHLDPWWNYAVENQATDRTHRIGQTRSVNVVKLIVENSIEQKVIELQNIKKDLASKIIRNESDSIEKISIDDISFLLD